MSTPLCAVIIPTYNRASWLPRCLASVRESALGDHEIVVVDDGSTDDTERVVRQHHGISYLRQENGGQAAARNAGLRASAAPYLAFLDDDDCFLPHQHRCMVDFLETNPHVAMVFADYLMGNDHDGYQRAIQGGQYASVYRLPFRPAGKQFRLLEGEPLLWALLPGQSFIVPSASVVRRSALQEVGFFDERLPPVEDLDLWLRMASRYPVAYRDAPASLYDRHDGNMSRNYWLSFRQYDALLEKVSVGLPELPSRLRKAASLRWARAAFHLGEHARSRERLARHAAQWGWDALAATYWLASWASPALIHRLRRLRSPIPPQ